MVFWPGKPLARRRPKKAEECVWRPPPCPNVERRYSTFQTKQVVFTRRDAAQPTSKNCQGCAKRERRHAPHASHRAQARRTRPSSSLPAPKQCSGNAPRAQVNVNSTGARGGRLDEESCDALAPAHLEWVQFSLQGVCNRIIISSAGAGETSSIMLCQDVLSSTTSRAACSTVLPRRSVAGHAAVLACAILWAAVCCTCSVRTCD